MGRIKVIATTALLLLIGVSLPHAQGAGTEWGILSREATQLSKQGNYNRAVIVAQKALKVAEENV